MTDVPFIILTRDRAWHVIDKIHASVGRARCAHLPHDFRRLIDGDDRYWCCRWCGLADFRTEETP